jgi:hypothetical protein
VIGTREASSELLAARLLSRSRTLRRSSRLRLRRPVLSHSPGRPMRWPSTASPYRRGLPGTARAPTTRSLVGTVRTGPRTHGSGTHRSACVHCRIVRPPHHTVRYRRTRRSVTVKTCRATTVLAGPRANRRLGRCPVPRVGRRSSPAPTASGWFGRCPPPRRRRSIAAPAATMRSSPAFRTWWRGRPRNTVPSPIVATGIRAVGTPVTGGDPRPAAGDHAGQPTTDVADGERAGRTANGDGAQRTGPPHSR